MTTTPKEDPYARIHMMARIVELEQHLVSAQETVTAFSESHALAQSRVKHLTATLNALMMTTPEQIGEMLDQVKTFMPSQRVVEAVAADKEFHQFLAIAMKSRLAELISKHGMPS